MTELGFGVLGTGYIAGKIADAIEAAGKARLAAVASRDLAKAETFVAGRSGAQAVEGIGALLARPDVEAVYLAIPTAGKEAAALAAVAAGKHVLIEKPLADAGSVERMVDAAATRDLVFMDATHFVHHPRRNAVRAALAERVGRPQVLHSDFYSRLDQRTNIRFDTALEPMGALGDLAWYCMRAVIEYLQPKGALAAAEAACRRDPGTGAVVQASGLLAFESGENATFGAGFDSGNRVTDLILIGPKGVITMDDFVMNWTNSISSDAPDVPTGYVHRSAAKTRKDFVFVETPSDTPQHVLMIEAFADLARSGDRAARDACADATRTTQLYLDAAWAKIAGASAV